MARDKNILNFIEEYGSINKTICGNLFFKNKDKYYSASRRLKILYRNNFLKKYKKDIFEDIVYYRDKKPLTPHDIKLLEVYSYLHTLGNIELFEREKVIMCGDKKRKNDGLIEIAIKQGNYEYTYPIVIEIDMTHDTTFKKIKDIYESNQYQDEYEIMPMMLIIKRNDFQKKVYHENVNIKYLPWSLEGIEDIFLDDE